MRPDDARQIFVRQVRQSLAERGAPLTALPPEQLDALVNAMADGTLAAMAAILDEVDQPAPPTRMDESAAAPAATEAILWSGRPYLSIGTRYELTTSRIRIFRGIVSQNLEEIELVRVRDTKVKQHAGERMLNVGDITVYSNDPTTPEFMLHNVPNPLEVRELIRKATLEEKQRRGFRYREEM